MAKPAFIYAFDNLGPARFAELCGLLLGSRYKGFLLGGVGPDGGIDGELDEVLGEWCPETKSPLISETIRPGQLVIFQFKHRVAARTGQIAARKQLLDLYRCSSKRKCELHRDLVVAKSPAAYVLVTNIEVNAQFRRKFVEQCKAENPEISHYQVIGLDDLESWITMEPELRHLYFPTIFGPPRFNLQVRLAQGFVAPHHGGVDLDVEHSIDLLQVSVLNVGTVPSYIGSISSISFKVIVDGKLEEPLTFIDLGANSLLKRINPEPGVCIEPGRKATYNFPFDMLRLLGTQGKDVFPVEVLVTDEIGNVYGVPIPDDVRDKMLEKPIADQMNHFE